MQRLRCTFDLHRFFFGKSKRFSKGGQEEGVEVAANQTRGETQKDQ